MDLAPRVSMMILVAPTSQVHLLRLIETISRLALTVVRRVVRLHSLDQLLD